MMGKRIADQLKLYYGFESLNNDASDDVGTNNIFNRAETIRKEREKDSEKKFESKPLFTVLKTIGKSLRGAFVKCFSINDRGNGVFEFRSMGGNNYHHRFDDIRKQTVRMANVLVLGSNETSYAKDYLMKLYKIFNAEVKTKLVVDDLSEFSLSDRDKHYLNDYLLPVLEKGKMPDSYKVRTIEVIRACLSNNHFGIGTAKGNIQLKRFITRCGLTKSDLQDYGNLYQIMGW